MTVDSARPILQLRGDVDLLTAGSIAAEGRRLLSTAGPGTSLVVDLDEVSFLDSAGLNALVQLRLLARTHGGDLILRNVPARVAKLLRISGLTDTFATQ